MSKKLQIHIPTPCHERWDAMTPVDKGRFCLSCQKKVIDFSGMSDDQLITYFKKPAISMCGHFNESQLNRDMQKSKKSLPWIKYFFQLAVPAFLVSIKVDGQKAPTKGKINVCANLNAIKSDTNLLSLPDERPRTITIKGFVINHEGLPVPFASIIVKGTKYGVHADSVGHFLIETAANDKVQTLLISSVGFHPAEKEVNLTTGYTQDLGRIQLVPAQAGEVVVVSSNYLQGRAGGFMAVRVITTNTLFDTIKPLFSKFTIYPNPAKQGQPITIANKRLPVDVYAAEFINTAGQSINKQQVLIAGKDKISLQVPATTAGVYFLKLKGSKSATAYTQKIIVE